MAQQDSKQPNARRNARIAEEVAAGLREDASLFRTGWDSLDEVQKADALEAFKSEVERFAAGNFEGRSIPPDEWGLDRGLSDADRPGEEGK